MTSFVITFDVEVNDPERLTDLVYELHVLFEDQFIHDYDVDVSNFEVQHNG